MQDQSEKEIAKKLSTLIKREKKKLGLSQSKIAFSSPKLSLKWVQAAEQGKQGNPTLKTLIELAKVFRMDTVSLIKEILL